MVISGCEVQGCKREGLEPRGVLSEGTGRGECRVTGSLSSFAGLFSAGSLSIKKLVRSPVIKYAVARPEMRAYWENKGKSPTGIPKPGHSGRWQVAGLPGCVSRAYSWAYAQEFVGLQPKF